MKKVIIAVVMILVLTTLLCACDGGKQNDAITTTAGELSTTAPDGSSETTAADSSDTTKDGIAVIKPDGTLVIATEKKTAYTIVRSEYCDTVVTTVSAELRNKLMELTGVSVFKIGSDWTKGYGRNDILEIEDPEILIGLTNRKESHDVHDTLKENQYVIKVVGKKLVIVGYDDYATANAVRDFIETFLTAKTETLTVSPDTYKEGTASIQKFPVDYSADLRVMSFNILGTDGSKGKTYEERRENIKQLLLDYLPDVVGFQEANKTTQNDILVNPTIAKYYAINVKTHSKPSTANYTPILYLKNKYVQIEGGVEWLKSRYEETNTKSLSWSVLERKSDGQRFIVVNMHGALWSPSYKLPAGETYESINEKAKFQWKIDNVNQMLEKIAALREKYGNLPTLTTGDYNFNSTHKAYTTMTSNGMASAEDSATKSRSRGASFHGTIGSYPDSNGRPIDHIFYSEDTVTALTYVICTREVDLNASDHCPVYSDVKFK